MRLGINKPDFKSGLEGQGWAGVLPPAAQGDGEERQGGEAKRRKAGDGREGSTTVRQMGRPGQRRHMLDDGYRPRPRHKGNGLCGQGRVKTDSMTRTENKRRDKNQE